MKNEGSVFELLISQHDEVDELIELIEDTDDPGEKSAIFLELADKLAAHSTIEEEIFYPWAMRADTEDLVRESTEEHLAVKRVLADLLAMDPRDPQWCAKLTVVKEEVRHHARDEEEGHLFPILRRASSQDERDALGGELLARFEELLLGSPSVEVPSQTDEAVRIEP